MKNRNRKHKKEEMQREFYEQKLWNQRFLSGFECLSSISSLIKVYSQNSNIKRQLNLIKIHMLMEFGDGTFGKYLESDEVLSVGLSVQSASVRTEQRQQTEGLELRCCSVSPCADHSHVITPQEGCHQADASSSYETPQAAEPSTI